MTPTREQRAMMAADLGERAAKLLRDGNDAGYTVLYTARCIEDDHDSAQDYRSGLMSCGMSYDEAVAAREAIARGKHPATSLPGRVAEMRASAQREIDRAAYNTAKAEALGKKFATGDVLEMLGCEVTP